MNDKSRYQQVILAIAALLLCMASVKIPIFWDNVLQASRVAHHFYENGLWPPLLSPEIDTGHPPCFGLYLALCWKIFGRNLLVSHLAMWPVLYLLFSGWYSLCKYYIKENTTLVLAVIIGLLESAVFTHLLMVGPELLLIAGVISAYYSLITRNYLAISILYILLVMVSIRGTIWVLAFFPLTISLHYGAYKSWWRDWRWQEFMPYIISALVALCWYGYHYKAMGYVTDNPQNTWSSSYRWIPLREVIIQWSYVAWRFIDQGRIIVLLLIPLLAYHTRNKANPSITTSPLLLFLITGIAFVILVTLRPATSVPRYFIPLYMGGSLVFFYYLQFFGSLLHKLFLGVLVAGFYLSGHLWIYPERIYQAWDCTLMHLSYYPLKDAMKDSLEKMHILLGETGTGSPLITPDKYTLLNNDTAAFMPIKDLNNEFLHYAADCRMCNGLSLSQKHELAIKWRKIAEWKNGIQHIKLYENPAWTNVK